MTSQTHTLPEDPEFTFCPAYDLETGRSRYALSFPA